MSMKDYHQRQIDAKLARGGRLFDWAWTGGRRACWRPVDKYREVKRGKKKGQFDCTLPDGTHIIVPRKALRLERDGLRRVL